MAESYPLERLPGEPVPELRHELKQVFEWLVSEGLGQAARHLFRSEYGINVTACPQCFSPCTGHGVDQYTGRSGFYYAVYECGREDFTDGPRWRSKSIVTKTPCGIFNLSTESTTLPEKRQ